MTDKRTTRAVARHAIVGVYTLAFLAYSAWLFYRMVSRLSDNDDNWVLEPIGILLLGEMGVDEALERLYEKGKVTEIQQWWSMMFNFAFFTVFSLYLDTEAWIVMKEAVGDYSRSSWSLIGAGMTLLGLVWYSRLPERAEGFIRLP
ncbi:hypothetical protein B0I73DRAFT_165923 [Yarrowia lipolytica]|uniref:YALI0C08921p n=2 Tax=Yarrowia lipolytica TaxID=4952 RepID=Q6CCJ2_YARLI|nr:YALI0C08921p [Yarrowia lipolytica CLIB122]AOW02551.1 hypothetical protein YALI1_C12194g [Yarrowia lipolytica]KAB8280133.1 hypothetical protein BKA91DRAFT_164447 [Yarrowia lipolytica]KAE8169068.1 hypothetical protein BKA90DRAFT_156297 [Yarrowia lipolytica]KAJ8053236.1 hypothetical protein LXG23DRAFT_37397 [Yarrowia lipolytica]QNP96511.1 Hypothetical protein YALI2_C00164g [Yarrowia lipolytica]|eukprot:XP_501620.2 YALI0C08921p [Yarrowia lipolytica CLIB122]